MKQFPTAQDAIDYYLPIYASYYKDAAELDKAVRQAIERKLLEGEIEIDET